MHPLAITFGLAISAVAAYVAVTTVLPLVAQSEAQAAIAEINTLSASLKQAERIGTTLAEREKIKNLRPLLKGWTCNGSAIPASGGTAPCTADGPNLDSSAGQNTITLNDDTPKGGFVITLQSNETCVNVKNELTNTRSTLFEVVAATSCSTSSPNAVDINIL